MVYTLFEFLATDFSQPVINASVCTLCPKPIMSNEQTEHTRDGLAHFDCYWETLSSLVEPP